MSFHGESHPGIAPTPVETQGFRFNHTMLRIKDPARALAFYSQVLGMQVMRRLDFDEMNFSLYFLAHVEESHAVPEDVAARTAWTFSRTGILELTHNWGTEDDADFAYHDGNAEPQGFGHICISVPNLEAAQAWFDAHDATFIKRADQGKMKDVIFIKDPDGYWIEVIQADRMAGKGD